MRLILTDSIAHAAKTVNEDLFDHNDQAAWIFDGATGIAKDTIPGAASDPQWLVQTVNEELKRVWDHTLPTSELFRRAAQNTIARYEKIVGDHAPLLIERPTACLAMARLWQGRLEISWVGDSGIIHQHDNIISSFGNVSSDAHGLVRKEQDRLTALGINGLDLIEQLLPHERAFRAKANVDGGYKIIDLTTRWTDRMHTATIDAQPGDKLLLTTDGLYRLVDIFKKHDISSLIEAAAEKGLAALYTQLRTLEQGDEACSLYPRVKMRDDVAAVLVVIS